MALHVYCPRMSGGARDLVEALGANRLRNFDGMNFWRKRLKIRVREGDIIVCWGHPLPELDGVRILNGDVKLYDKLGENQVLSGANIPTVYAVRGPIPKEYAQRGWEFIPRMANHVGGNDLLRRPARADFYVRKENIQSEFRIHSFNGKSIRAGIKVPRTPNPHPWIRSYDAGWRIDYDGFKSNEGMRKIAHKAVKALGLTFGAVDIGQLDNGNLIVLEVNRAPGIEGGTLEAYVRAIRKWVENPKAEAEDGAKSAPANRVQHEGEDRGNADPFERLRQRAAEIQGGREPAIPRPQRPIRRG